MSANKNLSLFIPFVFPNFDQKYVTNAFATVGNVERVDFVEKQDRAGKTYNAVYVHFNKWYINKLANNIYEQCFEKNGQTQFYHDDSNYFWIVLPNTAKKHVRGERKPRIELGNTNAINVKSIEKEEIEQKINDKPEPANNNDEEFEEYLEVLRAPVKEWEEDEIAEIEEMIEEDENLISIDGRYVQVIEQENNWFRGEIAQLRAALINLDRMYQVEAAKVRAFSSVGTSVDL
jgi:hypothetical protein